MYKSLHRLTASYLSNLIISYVSPRALRWRDAASFTLPRTVSESLMSPVSCITFLFQSRSPDALESNLTNSKSFMSFDKPYVFLSLFQSFHLIGVISQHPPYALALVKSSQVNFICIAQYHKSQFFSRGCTIYTVYNTLCP